MGASVLHEDAIFPVRAEGIPINIRNTNRPKDEGTLIVESTVKSPAHVITGVAGRKGFCSVNIDKAMMNAEIGFGRKVLQVMEFHLNTRLRGSTPSPSSFIRVSLRTRSRMCWRGFTAR